MQTRKIINIDEEKCTGCGECVVGCDEGALQIIDGVAKLVNEHFCDGLGACIGECPTNALQIEEREAKEFDIDAAKEHVKELRGAEAAENMVAEQKKHADNKDEAKEEAPTGGCPGMKMQMMDKDEDEQTDNQEVDQPSQLEQWPVQLDLLSPQAPYFAGADLLVTADCVPVAYGNYQQELKDKAVAMGCPKLDKAEKHKNKLAAIIAENNLNSITVLRMEVPCCGGMVKLTEAALEEAGSDLEIEVKTIGINGELK